MDTNRKLTNWLTLALGAGFVALVLAFVPSPLRLLDLFDSTPRIDVRTPPPLKMVAMPPATAFESITARPIFNAGRKPDPKATTASSAAAASVQGDLSEFRLVGIVTDNVIQRALIEKSGAASLRVGPGDVLAGWRIQKIDASGVVATKDGQSQKIVIPKSQPSGTSH